MERESNNLPLSQRSKIVVTEERSAPHSLKDSLTKERPGCAIKEKYGLSLPLYRVSDQACGAVLLCPGRKVDWGGAWVCVLFFTLSVMFILLVLTCTGLVCAPLSLPKNTYLRNQWKWGGCHMAKYVNLKLSGQYWGVFTPTKPPQILFFHQIVALEFQIKTGYLMCSNAAAAILWWRLWNFLYFSLLKVYFSMRVQTKETFKENL